MEGKRNGFQDKTKAKIGLLMCRHQDLPAGQSCFF